MTGITSILNKVVAAFAAIRGVSAIVLGGSRATGTARADSDIDIGIYYDDDFDLAAFRSAAIGLDDAHRENCVAAPGQWGPWINGGGWLTVDAMAVDLLLRSVSRVDDCIRDCLDGKITIDYQCGHPFGFVNAIYLGEVCYSKMLFEQTGSVSRFKAQLAVFPQQYKQAAIEKFLWECTFSLSCGRKSIGSGDILYACGSLFRCAVCLIQVLYAYHEQYCLNEKGCLKRLYSVSGVSKPFLDALEGCMSVRKDNLSGAFDSMEALLAQAKRLAEKQTAGSGALAISGKAKEILV